MKCRIAGLAGLLLSPLAQADFSIPGFELVHTVPLDTDLASADLRQPGRYGSSCSTARKARSTSASFMPPTIQARYWSG